MPEHVDGPTIIAAAGTGGKQIREYFGRVNSGDSAVSIAHMTSPPGWSEPGQTPEFDEYTVVLGGELIVETKDGAVKVTAGQAIKTNQGEWVKYSTPNGADYIAVCLPAFSPETVKRDE